MAKRREVSQQDQPLQSSDRKYYASRQGVSALQRTIADSTLKSVDELKPNPTPRLVDPKARRPEAGLPSSADKYYANDGKARSAVMPKAARAEPAIAKSGDINHVFIRKTSEITAKMREVIELLKQGAFQVRVGLAERSWLRQARQAIEFAVTREQITEDQSRDVVFGLVPADVADPPKVLPAPPKPAPEPAPVAELNPADELDRPIPTDRPVSEVDAEEAGETQPEVETTPEEQLPEETDESD